MIEYREIDVEARTYGISVSVGDQIESDWDDFAYFSGCSDPVEWAKVAGGAGELGFPCIEVRRYVTFKASLDLATPA